MLASASPPQRDGAGRRGQPAASPVAGSSHHEKREYEAIVSAGLTLQLDCPELAMSRDSTFAALSLEEYRKAVTMHVEVLNYAVADIPEDQMRMRVCWGRSERPHNTDVPLQDIVDLLLQAKPAGLVLTGANGRREHEWRVWREVKLPDGKVLIPGVIDNTTNIVEHSRTVADRILRYTAVVGRENVVAGVDCGFGTSPKGGDVDPRVGWAKLASLVEGAAIATGELWSG
jgi:5-methyltetrahydropteroyltriglutamate--homocysteine methyltransferase